MEEIEKDNVIYHNDNPIEFKQDNIKFENDVKIPKQTEYTVITKIPYEKYIMMKCKKTGL